MRNKIMLTLMMIMSMLSGVEAGTVENLERVRAKTITMMFDKNINESQRADKIEKLKIPSILNYIFELVLKKFNFSMNSATTPSPPFLLKLNLANLFKSIWLLLTANEKGIISQQGISVSSSPI